jgi:O-antigen/teichoic acid export membrane protein
MVPARALAMARGNAGALWLLGATTVANVLAYGYQVVMARLLRPEEYAILTAFFAVLILEQLGGQVVQSATAKLAAQYRARGEEPALHVFVRRWLRRILLAAGLPALVIVLAGPFVDVRPLSPFAVVVLGASLFLAIVLTFTLGLLQGLARFFWFGTIFIFIALTRLVVGVGLVLSFTGASAPPTQPVNGAFLGAAIAILLGALGTLVPLAPLLRAARGAVHEIDLGTAETRFFLLAAVIFICYAALTFVDGLVAPWRIPAESGAYAAAITMGKIVLFAPIAVGLILLERTSRADALGEDPDGYLFAALAFVLVTSGIVAVAYLAVPAPLTALIVGSQYPGTAAIVGPYGVAALSNALLSLWVAYFVGRGRMFIGALLAVAVAVELVLLVTVARDAAGMVRIVLGVSLAMQAAAIAIYAVDRARRARLAPA